MPRPLQGALSIHVVLTPPFGGRYYHPHFTDKKTEVLRAWGAPQGCSWQEAEAGSSPGRLAPSVPLLHSTEVSDHTLYLHFTEEDSGLPGGIIHRRLHSY